jgi:hypothetical protein
MSSTSYTPAGAAGSAAEGLPVAWITGWLDATARQTEGWYELQRCLWQPWFDLQFAWWQSSPWAAWLPQRGPGDE